MELLKYTLNQVSYAIVSPTYSLFLILIAIIFYIKNKKASKLQQLIIGVKGMSAFEMTISQIVMSILGGVLASVLIIFLGINFDINSSIYIIFLISVILMMFKPRFICLSYSGAILGIISIVSMILSRVLNNPKLYIFNINIMNLIALVGVMHLVEGILVMIDSRRGSVPVFANRDNNIIGGFIFNRYWSIPVVLFISLLATTTGGEAIATPNWWPLLNHNANKVLFETLAFSALPIYAISAYSNITFTKTKVQKTITSGILISIFGLILIIISPLANLGVIWEIALLILMPLIHEAVMFLDKRKEGTGKPAFVSPEDGFIILDVAPNSCGKELGLKSGDIILKINDIFMSNDEEISVITNELPSNLIMKIRNKYGKVIELEKNNIKSGTRLGVVVVPRVLPDKKKVWKVEESFHSILEKAKNAKKDINE